MKNKTRKNHGHTRKPPVSTRVWPLPSSCTTNLLSKPVDSTLEVATIVDRSNEMTAIDNGHGDSTAACAPSLDQAPIPPDPPGLASPDLPAQRRPTPKQPQDCGHWGADSGSTAAQVARRLPHPTPPVRPPRGRRTPRKQSDPLRWIPPTHPKRSRGLGSLCSTRPPAWHPRPGIRRGAQGPRLGGATGQ